MSKKEYPIDGAWTKCIIVGMINSNRTASTTTLPIKMKNKSTGGERLCTHFRKMKKGMLRALDYVEKKLFGMIVMKKQVQITIMIFFLIIC